MNAYASDRVIPCVCIRETAISRHEDSLAVCQWDTNVASSVNAGDEDLEKIDAESQETGVVAVSVTMNASRLEIAPDDHHMSRNVGGHVAETWSGLEHRGIAGGTVKQTAAGSSAVRDLFLCHPCKAEKSYVSSTVARVRPDSFADEKETGHRVYRGESHQNHDHPVSETLCCNHRCDPDRLCG